MYNLIKKKRDGGELSRDEIFYMIDGYTNERIPDYQMSAMLMAIFMRGMSDAETYALTDAMLLSGDSIDLSCFGSLSADKHSTGGVGDKTSLIVVPIAAELGCKIAKMSGRGLGHTGGTVDKLESISGYKTSLSSKEFLKQAQKVGIALTGQSGNLAPADKKLYALRDVTATVDSLPLIASSIMSKKLAAGAKNIVLDVKVGSGAFMKTYEDAKKLAQIMVKIGTHYKRNVRALITNMDIPLGNAVGNALEVKEAVEVLRGVGDDDLREICINLSAQMASSTLDISFEEAKEKAFQALSSGRAFNKLCEWVSTQGGDEMQLHDTSLLPKASISYEIFSEESGFISAMNSEAVGIACVILGGGRKTKDDSIDHSAGILLHKKTGDKVNKGDLLATLYTNNESSLPYATEQFKKAVSFSGTKPEKAPLIYGILQ